MNSHQTGAYALRSACRKDGGSHHAITAGNDIERAVVIFVDKRVKRLQHFANILLLNEIEIGGSCRYRLGTQINIKNYALSYALGVLAEEEREALRAKCQSEIGADDVAAVDAFVPLTEESRRHVDSHDKRLAVVDILHERSVTTLQRAVQPRTKEAIDHHVVRSKLGRVEVVDNLGKVDIAHVEQSLTIGGTALAQVGRLDIKQEHLGPVILLIEQSCHR